jgi:hypothetical protein
MSLPGGNRLEATDARLRERLLNTGRSGEEKPSSARIRICGLLLPGSRSSAAGGVWLGTDTGGGTADPFSVRPGGDDDPEADLASPGDENADEETLDAACWLMPGIPRDLIAEALELGPYRRRVSGS